MFENIEKFKYNINYTFSDMKLLKEALTHRSYATEKRLNYDNQRLEYLGDAVIQIIVTEYLFNRYPSKKEGFLTKVRASLVQESSLAIFAKEISLGEFMFFGKGEVLAKAKNRDSALADAFESLMGAIFIDSNINIAKRLFLDLIRKVCPEPTKLLRTSNAKGSLQEYTIQKHNVIPIYKVKSECGPSHSPKYEVEVYIADKVYGNGQAKKKKDAEQIAAKSALYKLKKNG